MELIPSDSLLFRNAIEALKDFLPQAQLRISAEGLYINGMDSSHVGFVDYKLAALDCDAIAVPSPLTLGINLGVLARTLGAVGGGDRVVIGVNKNQDKLLVSYTNDKVGKKVAFEVPLMDITDDSLELPDIQYAGTVVLKTADIASVIREVTHFGEVMTLRLDPDGFHISATGDVGSVRQTLELTEDRMMELTEDSVEASFGTKYMSGIMKGGASLSATTRIEFDGMQPMRATFQFGTGSHFVSYLAPKVMD